VDRIAEKEDVMHEPLLFLFLGVGSIALFSFLAVATWTDARRREREAYYKSEALKKIAETQGAGASSAIEFLREEALRRAEEKKEAARHQREGIKLGGLVTSAVGIGLMIFLRTLVEGEPVYLVGLIPLLVGVALLVYSYLLAPKE
jgi:nucleoside recognition membrane protein YjiH